MSQQKIIYKEYKFCNSKNYKKVTKINFSEVNYGFYEVIKNYEYIRLFFKIENVEFDASQIYEHIKNLIREIGEDYRNYEVIILEIKLENLFKYHVHIPKLVANRKKFEIFLKNFQTNIAIEFNLNIYSESLRNYLFNKFNFIDTKEYKTKFNKIYSDGEETNENLQSIFQKTIVCPLNNEKFININNDDVINYDINTTVLNSDIVEDIEHNICEWIFNFYKLPTKYCKLVNRGNFFIIENYQLWKLGIHGKICPFCTHYELSNQSSLLFILTADGEFLCSNFDNCRDQKTRKLNILNDIIRTKFISLKIFNIKQCQELFKINNKVEELTSNNINFDILIKNLNQSIYILNKFNIINKFFFIYSCNKIDQLIKIADLLIYKNKLYKFIIILNQFKIFTIDINLIDLLNKYEVINILNQSTFSFNDYKKNKSKNIIFIINIFNIKYIKTLLEHISNESIIIIDKFYEIVLSLLDNISFKFLMLQPSVKLISDSFFNNIDPDDFSFQNIFFQQLILNNIYLTNDYYFIKKEMDWCRNNNKFIVIFCTELKFCKILFDYFKTDVIIIYNILQLKNLKAKIIIIYNLSVIINFEDYYSFNFILNSKIIDYFKFINHINKNNIAKKYFIYYPNLIKDLNNYNKKIFKEEFDDEYYYYIANFNNKCLLDFIFQRYEIIYLNLDLIFENFLCTKLLNIFQFDNCNKLRLTEYTPITRYEIIKNEGIDNIKSLLNFELLISDKEQQINNDNITNDNIINDNIINGNITNGNIINGNIINGNEQDFINFCKELKYIDVNLLKKFNNGKYDKIILYNKDIKLENILLNELFNNDLKNDVYISTEDEFILVLKIFEINKNLITIWKKILERKKKNKIFTMKFLKTEEEIKFFPIYNNIFSEEFTNKNYDYSIKYLCSLINYNFIQKKLNGNSTYYYKKLDKIRISIGKI